MNPRNTKHSLLGLLLIFLFSFLIFISISLLTIVYESSLSILPIYFFLASIFLTFFVTFIVYSTRKPALNNVQPILDLKSILQATEAPLIAVDTKGKITIFNRAASKLTGIDGHVALNQTPIKLLKIENYYHQKIEESQSPFIEVLDTKNTFTTNTNNHYYIKTAPDINLPVTLTISPINGPHNQITGAVCIINDISTTKQLQELQNEFILLATHELKNPVAVIMGFLEIAQEAHTKSAQIKTAINGIQQANQILVKLIDNILQISRSESGQMHPKITSVNYIPILNQAVKDHQKLASIQKLKIRADIPSAHNNIVVNIDTSLVEEILNNLINNAIKYSNPLTTVNIKTQLSLSPNSYVPIANKKARYLITHISDNGIGIPLSEQPHVFDKFFRASNIQEQTGSGLGLFIVKQYVEKLQGQIWFKSTENEGSTFSYSLPITK